MKFVRATLLVMLVLMVFIGTGALVWVNLKKVLFPSRPTLSQKSDPRRQPELNQSKRNDPGNPVAKPEVPDAPIGQIRFAEDAPLKKGDFWLEQPFALTEKKVKDGTPFLRLYAGFDPTSGRYVALTFSGGKAALEYKESKTAEPKILAEAATSELPAGDYTLGLQWRAGNLSVWVGPRELFTWEAPKDSAEAAKVLALDSALQVLATGVRPGARRALASKSIRFDDNFMRATPSDDWHPLCGQWEMTAMAFAERSANPFSLRASFNGRDPFADDPLYAEEKRTRQGQYGVGVQISLQEGTPHIVRITGGGPAAHAGLQEDDIFVEINGVPTSQMHPYEIYQPVNQMAGEARLKMYRPGEKTFRDVVLQPGVFKWGVSIEAQPIDPVRPPETRGSDAVSVIMAGEEGWSDYQFEAACKPLGAGGFGLIAGASSDRDYLLFRWRGPKGGEEEQQTSHDKLELVRVVDGRETILATKSARYRPYEFYRMGLDWSGERVRALIDKNEIFSVKVPDLKRGRIGLYAIKGKPVFFDDVHVAGDRALTSAWHLAERSLNSIFALEDDMEIWANPALEWERDVKSGWAIHNQRFPGEQAVSIAKPRFDELQIALYSGNDPEDAALPRLTIRGGVAQISGSGIESQRVTLGAAGNVQHIGFDVTAEGVHAAVDGKVLKAAWIGGKPILDSVAGVRARGAGEHLAIKGLKNLGDPAAVRVTSTGTMEYTFDNAPSDWKVASGRWGLLNKWICDPRWSWFGGRTKTCAATWNKHIFTGDVSVDAHIALMMMRDDPPFERPGDYNLTICGDGKNLDSGYTLIFGGDINSWTRLYRKGVMVAEARKEEFRVFSDRIRHPDKPDLHQRWFHLKLEKIGSTVTFYRDGKKAFDYVDPEPLSEGRVAFWTMDNGFLISRLRIAHGGARPAPFEDANFALFDDAKVVNIFDGETPTLVTREEIPAPIKSALILRSSDPSVAAFPAISAKPSLEAEPPAEKEAAYRVVNSVGGGAFALQFRQMFDIEREGVIRFAYRIEPGAQVDFYLLGVRDGDFNPRHQACYRWRMSGPKSEEGGLIRDEFAPLVGEIPGIQADGDWHIVQFDLQPSWQQFMKGRGFMRAVRSTLRPMFGNLSNTGYLLAGMNGNRAGATYAVTNFRAFAAKEALHLEPSVARVVWPYDTEGDGQTLRVYFDVPSGTGIRPESIGVTIDKHGISALPGPGDAAASFDMARQRLSINLQKLHLPGAVEGATVELKVAPGFEDRAGNTDAQGFTSKWVYHASEVLRAAKPVHAPVVAAHLAGMAASVPEFEALTAVDVLSLQPAVRLETSLLAPDWAPAGQRRSLEVIATNELSVMGFRIHSLANYDLQRWPYLELEYKVPAETPFNLHLFDDAGQDHSLTLVKLEEERDHLAQNIVSHFGPPEDFVADNTWRSCTVPLGRLFRGANPTARMPSIADLHFTDSGWHGARRGLHYWIHSVRAVPAGRPAELALAFSAEDFLGIAEYESCIDGAPATEPAGKKELTGADETLAAILARNGTKLKDGFNYVHVRARNAAGVWSQTVHRKFMLDTSGPVVVKTEPPDGGKLQSQTLRIHLAEDHGVDLAGAQLRVEGQDVLPFTEFDAAGNVLKYDAQTVGKPFAPGAKISVELRGMADRFGNKQAAPYTFSFVADAQPGRPGPELQSLALSGGTERSGIYRQYDMELSFGLDFEEHFGHVHAIRDCKMEWLDDPALANGGRRAVRFTSQQDDGDLQIMLHKNAWFIDKLPLLHFDYKADPGFRVDVQLEAFGAWHTIRFLGDGKAGPDGVALGGIAEVRADGTWHHASVDMGALLDAAQVRLPARIVDKIMLSAHGGSGCKRGATLTLDNVDMLVRGALGMRGSPSYLKVAAKETPSGLGGYSVSVDRDPAGDAPAVIKSRSDYFPLQARSGAWYAHARACDQAGNWGPTKTIRIEFGEYHGRAVVPMDDDAAP